MKHIENSSTRLNGPAAVMRSTLLNHELYLIQMASLSKAKLYLIEKHKKKLLSSLLRCSVRIAHSTRFHQTGSRQYVFVVTSAVVSDR